MFLQVRELKYKNLQKPSSGLKSGFFGWLLDRDLCIGLMSHNVDFKTLKVWVLDD